jgi:hypothetical protein
MNPVGSVYRNEKNAVEWKDLIPQVVWRGTDLTYLAKLRKLRSPDFDADLLVGTGHDGGDDGSDEGEASRGIRAMKRIYEELLARWKGVVLTAEAEGDAAHQNVNDDHRQRVPTLPWANIKFSHYIDNGKKTPTDEGTSYQNFRSRGIPAIGEYLPLETVATYKYHIDLGGRGEDHLVRNARKIGPARTAFPSPHPHQRLLSRGARAVGSLCAASGGFERFEREVRVGAVVWDGGGDWTGV